MSQRGGNGRRVYALTDYTVERTAKGWFYGRTSRFGDMHAMKGPYSTAATKAPQSRHLSPFVGFHRGEPPPSPNLVRRDSNGSRAGRSDPSTI